MKLRPAFLYTLAALDAPVSAVILDFGGVLGLSQDPVRVRNMASLCGVTVEQFSLMYYGERLELDRGTLSMEEYWARIFSEAGREPTQELIARIEEEDSRGWIRINQRMVDWAAELRATGYRTAILSNMPTSKLRFIRGDPAFSWINDFPVAVFSCDYRRVKPEPAIYATCLGLLDRKPSECLFLDDSTANVEGGRAVGLPSMLFRSAEEAAPDLSGRWRLPVGSLLRRARDAR